MFLMARISDIRFYPFSPDSHLKAKRISIYTRFSHSIYDRKNLLLKLRKPSQEQMSVKGGVKVDHWGLGETEIERMATAFEHEDLKKARGK
jgi:hypothetical protein